MQQRNCRSLYGGSWKKVSIFLVPFRLPDVQRDMPEKPSGITGSASYVRTVPPFCQVYILDPRLLDFLQPIPFEGRFMNVEGKYMCESCAKAKYEADLPRCATCGQPVATGLKAEGKSYHSKCFVCSECRKPFPGGSYMLWKDRIVCESCAKALRGAAVTTSPSQAPSLASTGTTAASTKRLPDAGAYTSQKQSRVEAPGAPSAPTAGPVFPEPSGIPQQRHAQSPTSTATTSSAKRVATSSQSREITLPPRAFGLQKVVEPGKDLNGWIRSRVAKYNLSFSNFTSDWRGISIVTARGSNMINY